jgi:hypothetical protein
MGSCALYARLERLERWPVELRGRQGAGGGQGHRTQSQSTRQEPSTRTSVVRLQRLPAGRAHQVSHGSLNPRADRLHPSGQ